MNHPAPDVPEGVQLFATVINGKIRGVGQAVWPPHELKPNQFELTEKEFHFLKNLTNLDQAMPILEGIQKKIRKINKKKSHEKALHHQDS